MLHDQPAFVDVHFAADLFSRLVNVLGGRADPELPCASRCAGPGRLPQGRLDPRAKVLARRSSSTRDHLAEIADQTDVDPELLATLAAQAVGHLFGAYAERLLPIVERADDGARRKAPPGIRGYCPICGGWLLLAERRGIELAQYLRCAACGSGWRSQRLFCPYCANEDYQTLRTLTIDGEQRFRVAVCERCKRYLKVGNAFDPPPASWSLSTTRPRCISGRRGLPSAAITVRGGQRLRDRAGGTRRRAGSRSWSERRAAGLGRI